MFDSILLAAVPNDRNYFAQKSYGVHRTATEFRKQGLSCQVVHYFNRFSDKELTSLIDSMVGDDTKIVGFSTMFWEHFDDVEKKIVMDKTKFVANYLYMMYPDVKIIAGGPSCRILLDELIQLDAIFEGFSENDFIKYIRGENPIPNQFHNETQIFNNINGSFDFTTSVITYEANDHMDHTDVPILEVARGCIFRCKFCAFALNGKKKLDYIKDPKVLRDELIRNYEEHGIQNYIFSDDTFNDSPYKVELLHDVFTNLDFRVNFSTYLRLDLLNAHKQEIQQLKEMGMVGAFFGVESFHKKASALVGKGMDPDHAKEMLSYLKEEAWGDDIKIGIGLITGLPYETYESYDETIEWILDEKNKIDQVVPFPLSVTNPNNVRPQPWDSEFQKNADKYGFQWPDGSSTNWINTIGPVSSRDEAVDLWMRMRGAVQQTKRQKQGGFNLLKTYPLAQHADPNITLEKLLKMDRYTYSEWLENNINDEVENRYVECYKSKLKGNNY
jgi:hypothetical protein